MTTIVYRSVKGSPLTNNEIDTNFSNINTDIGLKAPIASPTFTGLLITAPSTFGGASFRLPPGDMVMEQYAIDGDIWITTSNIYGRIGGVTKPLITTPPPANNVLLRAFFGGF